MDRVGSRKGERRGIQVTILQLCLKALPKSNPLFQEKRVHSIPGLQLLENPYT